MWVESREATADSNRPRAVLVLSLIVLIYNLAATARQDFFYPDCFPVTARTAAEATTTIPSGKTSPESRNARRGGLTLRQKFLSGYRIDVNRAPMIELTGLPGISDKVASAVVAERNRIGRFKSPADLLEVTGIKEKRLQKILPFLSGFDNN